MPTPGRKDGVKDRTAFPCPSDCAPFHGFYIHVHPISAHTLVIFPMMASVLSCHHMELKVDQSTAGGARVMYPVSHTKLCAPHGKRGVTLLPPTLCLPCSTQPWPGSQANQGMAWFLGKVSHSWYMEKKPAVLFPGPM
jgi:hypothetical protein